MLQVAREDPGVAISVGSIAGWLVDHFSKGTGFGILGVLVAAIAGAFVGVWLLSELNVHLGPESSAANIDAAFAALSFLFAIGILRAAIERGASRGEAGMALAMNARA